MKVSKVFIFVIVTTSAGKKNKTFQSNMLHHLNSKLNFGTELQGACMQVEEFQIMRRWSCGYLHRTLCSVTISQTHLETVAQLHTLHSWHRTPERNIRSRVIFLSSRRQTDYSFIAAYRCCHGGEDVHFVWTLGRSCIYMYHRQTRKLIHVTFNEGILRLIIRFLTRNEGFLRRSRDPISPWLCNTEVALVGENTVFIIS
jgi:hypothetical protein